MSLIHERELLQNIKNNSTSCFYYYANDVYVQSEIEEVKNEKNFMRVNFNNGFIDIDKGRDIIEKVKRPDVNLKNYDWCYSIMNSNKRIKGWILKEAE
ncbi:hypothetical protein [Clostridium butyricum]|uniref:Uncharacterized protein n=1 Tax=Clostridium butyricum TaxID=1492 RepID=A0AAP9UF15_CLOBU|nr:hypothetical protein [Clostridium butyricum]MBZ5747010.1 hypothetical protein [Clostridium butyricum]MDI9207899.1 hypothetical protein [Clostridium butyricum]QMW91903.1 hypothetical protein FF104_13245 [Clostridium butyricum]BBK75867.1 hypothetical protein Cbu04g_08750 [Clostridium butyricum]GEQ27698.1 hypothetical protein CBU03nite_41210 [Clostridium butyricum]